MPEGDQSSVAPAEVEAAVRRYVGHLAVRYVPLVAVLLTLALILILVPRADGGGKKTVASGAASGTEQGASGSESFSATGTPVGGNSGAGGSTGGGATGGGGSSNRPLAVPAGITPPAAAGSVGVARSGVNCGPGVRQVTWTKYAPLCVPAYKGNNGGATSHGVTGDTITISFRLGNSTEDTAVYAAAGQAAPAPDPDIVADMQTYVDYFNKTYELYGRKVVLKAFQGQGDYIREDQGQDQGQAAADAAKSHDLGAFADATFNLKGSRPFWTSLAQQKVVAFGPLGFPQSWYQQYSPYWYSTAPTGSKQAQFITNMVCRRMAGMPAIFAGDATYRGKTRTFGLVTPENPEYMQLGDEVQNGLKRCGVSITRRANYTINVANFGPQGTSIAAQMKAAGVTTLLCYCDPLIPIFLSQAAQQQQYSPEWYEPYYRDPQGRLMDKNQWSHAISYGGTSYARTSSEAYKAFKLAQPNGEPKAADQYFDVQYATLLHIFGALQAAGPNLTPETLQRGLFSSPQTDRGDFGTWSGGQGAFSPGIDAQIGYYDQNAVSPWDGNKGAWQSCEGGALQEFAKPESFGPDHTQLHCFGK